MSLRLKDLLPGLFSQTLDLGGGLLVDKSGNVTVPGTTITGSKANVIDVTTATKTLTAAQSGSIVLLDKTDGVTVTLPAPVVGLTFTFLYVVDQASSATVIVTDAGTTFVQGGIDLIVVNSATSKGFVGNGTTHVKVTSNATTTGGLQGGILNATCVSPTVWNISGQLVGSGTIATPFST